MNHILITDGACRGNPGPMGLGIILLDKDEVVVAQKHLKPGRGTNNTAETLAFLNGLELAQEMGIDRLACFSDSQLLTNQLTGAFKINKPELKDLHKKINEKKKKFKFLSIQWHPRETPYGMVADAISRGILFTEGVSICQQIPRQLRRPTTNS